MDGGKDVREGFTHIGSSHFCVCVCVQKVSREVDVWVVFCVVILSPLLDSNTLSSPPSYSVFFPSCPLSSGYPMVLPLVWRIVSWKDSERER